MIIKNFLSVIVVGFFLSACETNTHKKNVILKHSFEANTNLENWEPQKMYRVAGFAWVELATLYGHPQAVTWQRNLMKELSQKEITEGKLRALTWKTNKK